MSHPVAWVTASPAWEGTPQPPAPEPMLLRFASDSFMEDVQGVLDRAPAALPALRAPKESFRARPLGKDDSWTPPEPPTLKLYQPIHGHFYLVAAALVCRLPGFPDHEVRPAQKEKVSFVLRRVVPGGELAWSTDPLNGNGWVAADPTVPAPYEELHPLAPLNFTVADGRRRRLFVGLVPTATRDTYVAGGSVDPYPTTTATGAPLDTRLTEFRARVVGALASLADATGTPDAVAAQFALLDFADFLHAQLDAASYAALFGTTRPAGATLTQLWDDLQRPLDSTLTLGSALQSALAQADAITGESTATPSFPSGLAAELQALAKVLVPDGASRGSALVSAVTAWLPTSRATTITEGRPASSVEVPKLAPVSALDGAESPPRFRLRCVYQRPECGPLHPPLVSEATEPFTFSSFFDFDAPQRAIRIALPVDTSIKDLRKFRKNVSFVISEQLKNQMNQIGALKDVMSGKLETADSSTVGFGMICSFSIPIITICALIVLMIFLYLLNIVFWWVPFFRICFPFPKRAAS